METVRHISEKTEKEFKESYSGMIPGALEKVVEGWCGDLKVLGYSIHPGDKLVVAAEEIEQTNGNKYFLFRFFPGGKENWQASADLQNVSEEVLLSHLLKKMK